MRAILTYHSIDTTGSAISISPTAFAGHLRWLTSGRVRVLSLDEIVRESRADANGDGDAVAITFDDGFANFAVYAAPMLLAHAIPVSIFVVSEHVGATNAWGGREAQGIPTLPLLGWDALGRLAEGGIEIGAHTRTHAALDTLEADAVEAEIVGGAEDLEARLGRRPRAFAYPYGIAPPAATDRVREYFAVAVTTRLHELRSSDDRALLPRLDAYYLRHVDGLDAWGSARFRAFLRLRAAARSARQHVGRRMTPAALGMSFGSIDAVSAP